ncbi:MAG: hypothetical protein Q8K35_02070 [Thiobacillus sp.]|nr:hypothetical protein [Thiobacillus sp.]
MAKARPFLPKFGLLSDRAVRGLSRRRHADAALPALLGTPVQVEFTAGDSVVFRFNGRVARVSPSGVGVFVAAMPEDALQALRTASERLARPDSAWAASDLSPQQAQALQLECTSLFRSFLDMVLQDFFQRGVERLGQAGQDELSFLERSRYDYGAQERRSAAAGSKTIFSTPYATASSMSDRRKRPVERQRQTGWPSSRRPNSRTG